MVHRYRDPKDRMIPGLGMTRRQVETRLHRAIGDQEQPKLQPTQRSGKSASDGSEVEARIDRLSEGRGI